MERNIFDSEYTCCEKSVFVVAFFLSTHSVAAAEQWLCNEIMLSYVQGVLALNNTNRMLFTYVIVVE